MDKSKTSPPAAAGNYQTSTPPLKSKSLKVLRVHVQRTWFKYPTALWQHIQRDPSMFWTWILMCTRVSSRHNLHFFISPFDHVYISSLWPECGTILILSHQALSSSMWQPTLWSHLITSSHLTLHQQQKAEHLLPPISLSLSLALSTNSYYVHIMLIIVFLDLCLRRVVQTGSQTDTWGWTTCSWPWPQVWLHLDCASTGYLLLSLPLHLAVHSYPKYASNVHLPTPANFNRGRHICKMKFSCYSTCVFDYEWMCDCCTKSRHIQSFIRTNNSLRFLVSCKLQSWYVGLERDSSIPLSCWNKACVHELLHQQPSKAEIRGVSSWPTSPTFSATEKGGRIKAFRLMLYLSFVSVCSKLDSSSIIRLEKSHLCSPGS